MKDGHAWLIAIAIIVGALIITVSWRATARSGPYAYGGDGMMVDTRTGEMWRFVKEYEDLADYADDSILRDFIVFQAEQEGWTLVRTEPDTVYSYMVWRPFSPGVLGRH